MNYESLSGQMLAMAGMKTHSRVKREKKKRKKKSAPAALCYEYAAGWRSGGSLTGHTKTLKVRGFDNRKREQICNVVQRCPGAHFARRAAGVRIKLGHRAAHLYG